ncbi:hypothetical protein CKAH01_01441 [Colletotrichum kahawae]|uniref:Aminoglycoside phosphotransferase domain-containing protein n=1 Tax=Colletotrichum kahawae TaxID=34407 RepID=A0AAE0D476_COLKA|nr:hypothetical protein CKAH01_01441 [Colletotrichum kahawae]
MSNAGDTKQSAFLNAGAFKRALILSTVWITRNRYFRRYICKSPQWLVSKFGFYIKVKSYASLGEAHALQFIHQQTSIPVPRVSCAFIHRGRTYIVMARIDRNTACLRWVKRSEASKKQILDQLKDIICQLRAIPPPPEGTRVCNVDGGPIWDCRLPSKEFWGPFATAKDFYRELVQPVSLEADVGGEFADIDDSLNVLVRGDDVVGVIDWETAGWLPSYWEYSSAWHVNLHNPFWQQEVDKFVAPMRMSSGWIRFVTNTLASFELMLELTVIHLGQNHERRTEKAYRIEFTR